MTEAAIIRNLHSRTDEIFSGVAHESDAAARKSELEACGARVLGMVTGNGATMISYKRPSKSSNVERAIYAYIVDGRALTVSQMAKIAGVSYSAMHERLANRGPSEAIAMEKQTKKQQAKNFVMASSAMEREFRRLFHE